MTRGFPRRHIASLTGLAVALVLPAILSASAPDELPTGADAMGAILINEAVVWALALAVLAIVRFWERLPFTSIGLGRPTRAGILAGGAVTAILMLLAMGAGLAVQASGLSIQSDEQQELLVSLPVWIQMLVAISAGFTEEILFRGYAIERVTALTGSRWLGAIAPVLVFGGIHAPFWGWGHALVAGLSGLWLTLIYLWRRNLWTNITAHALLDALAFIAVDLASKGAAT